MILKILKLKDMEIYIENFKGIRSAHYVFNKSTTLICGKSGIGKSSILESISYLICGDSTRGLANVGSNGKILVKMIIGNLEIIRTNKPKRLLVKLIDADKLYEDEHAQSYVDSYFTIFFKDVAYIRQKGVSSFLQKNSTEKMDFLRLWITNDKNIQQMKSRLKIYTKSLDDKLEKLFIKLEVAKQLLNGCCKPEIVKNPIPIEYDPIEFQKYKNLQLHNVEFLYTSNYNKHKKLSSLLKHEQILLRKSELDRLCSNINIDIIHKNIESLGKLKHYMSQLKNIKMSSKTLTQLKYELNELKQKNIDNKINKQVLLKITELKDQISKKNGILSDLHRKYNEYNVFLNDMQYNIDEHKKMVKICDKFIDTKNILQQCIRSLEKYEGVLSCGHLELSFSSVFFDQLSLNICCPQCNSYLQIIDSNKLSVNILKQKSDNFKTINKSLKDLYVEYNKYRYEYDDYIQKYSFDDLNRDYKTELKNKCKELDDVKYKLDLCKNIIFPNESTNIYNLSIVELVKTLHKIEYAEDELTKLYANYPNLTDLIDDNIDEYNINVLEKHICDIEFNQEINDKIEHLKQQLNINCDININYLDEMINEYNLQIKNWNEYQSILKIKIDEIDFDFSLEKFNEMRHERDRLQFECKILSSIILNIKDFKEQLKHYIEYVNKKIEYNNLKHNLEYIQSKYDKLKYKYNNCILLKSIIEKTEGRMIDMFIYDLNEKIQYYTDQFFVDDTMNIDLRCIKNKREQPKLAFNIIYKGNQIDDVKGLSGGEYDRLNLAIALSFADLLKLPLIMFDESVNSLDDVACTNVLEKIKNCDRITLIVAHQIEEGLFDNTLCIK